MTLVVCNRIVRAMKPPEYNASYLALVHKSFQGDIQLSGPLTLMSCKKKKSQFWSNDYMSGKLAFYCILFATYPNLVNFLFLNLF